MNKKIITIAGIVFALIFVVLLAVMMGTITTKANSANSKLVDTLEMTDNTSLSIYDDTTVKGESVLNAIKNVKQIGSGTKLEITVVTGNGKTDYYGYTTKAKTENLPEGEKKNDFSVTPRTSTPSNANNDYYINPSANFKSTLDPNDNDVVIGIKFEQI